MSSRGTRRPPKKCRLCKWPVLDAGVRLSKLNPNKLGLWWWRMFDDDLDENTAKYGWFCQNCVFTSRQNHEKKKGPGSEIWWSKRKSENTLFKYFTDKMMKPCLVSLTPVTEEEILKWQIKQEPEEDLDILCEILLKDPSLAVKPEHPPPELAPFPEEQHIQDPFALLRPNEDPPPKFFNRVQCVLCEKVFHGQAKCRVHIREAHAQDVFVCNLDRCNLFFGSHYDFSNHQSQKHSISSFRPCRKGASIVTPPAPPPKVTDSGGKKKRPGQTRDIPCHLCKNIFTKWDSFKLHMKVAHKENNFFCPLSRCTDFFTSEKEMDAHVQNIHPNCVQCEVCQKYFSNSTIFEAHVFFQHRPETKSPRQSPRKKIEQNQKGQPCPHCEKMICNMPSHIKNRHPDKLIQCPYGDCPALFVQQEELDTHVQNKHLKVSDHPCPFCKGSFGCQKARLAHIRACHKDEMPCCPHPGCGLRFACQKNLDIHSSKVHGTSECPNCKKSFKKKSLLKEHLKFCQELNNNDTKRSFKQDLDTVDDQDEAEVSLRVKREMLECPYCDFRAESIFLHVMDHKMQQRQQNLRSQVKMEMDQEEEAPPSQPEEEPQVCPTCSTSFTNLNEFEQHKLACKPTSFECHICHRKFKTAWGVRRHLVHVSNHQPQKWKGLEFESLGFKCDECKKYFRSGHHLYSHNYNSHGVRIGVPGPRRRASVPKENPTPSSTQSSPKFDEQAALAMCQVQLDLSDLVQDEPEDEAFFCICQVCGNQVQSDRIDAHMEIFHP